jgi:protein TonB
MPRSPSIAAPNRKPRARPHPDALLLPTAGGVAIIAVGHAPWTIFLPPACSSDPVTLQTRDRMDLSTAPATAETDNVIALDSVRRAAPAIEPSAFWLVPDDRPAPARPHRPQLWIALFFAVSIAAHAGVLAVIDSNPEPLPSIGVVSLSVELVVGTDIAAGLATAPRPNETGTVEPSQRADADATPAETASAKPAPADTASWVDRLAAFQQALPPGSQAAEPERPPQPEAPPSVETENRHTEVLAAVTASSEIGRGASTADATYPAIVAARLARFKQYPADARTRGQQGSATVTFTLDGDGSVSQVSLTKKSGTASLDRESQAMVRRAAPFPPTPTGGPMSFTVPVNFSLR